jgi:hypothetical protein
MTENKTVQTDASVTAFLDKQDPASRADCLALIALMQRAAGAPAKMWGTSIIGFGQHQLLYASGRVVDAMKIGFAPRKGTLALYGLGGALRDGGTLLDKLGKHEVGKGCVWIKRMSDVDEKALAVLLARGIAVPEGEVAPAKSPPAKPAAAKPAKSPAAKPAAKKK